ncbi:MAG: phosphoribosylaminoimidazolesuccinocarboxamide synthase [Candidatus Altiarchaeota archaeon]|nr:phosphoribosylaminoimidazolesuccinocarboxamide synthase [Candidatus Altiarchaeota archaeon]MBU4437638.1 phosphoribosylaminoimidazolesuccinocarboxamide synthase [Candidatus Altiarchaeota archaeon]
MIDGTILTTEIPELKLFQRGKVRDIYDLGDKLLIIATDRISAFDSVLPTGIPMKGRVLTALSVFWFDYTKGLVGNHLISADDGEFPGVPEDSRGILEGRSMLVKKAQRIDIECVARGYLSGSAWAEYQKTGSVCGIELPTGLAESEKLQEPIFTPAIKASSGHDENVSEERMNEIVGDELGGRLREITLKIYTQATAYAESRGIIIADTKFEFGLLDGELILIDELLTPDSSRFWPMDDYSPGRAQKSFDKQFVRDYLAGINWDKEPPAPELPEEIVMSTRNKYLDAHRLITGNELKDANE